MPVTENAKKIVDEIIDERIKLFLDAMLAERIGPEFILDKFVIFGHRGWGPTSKFFAGKQLLTADVAPENSLEAFDRAYRSGADGVELDVFMTADGHVVVSHDDELLAHMDGEHIVVKKGEGPLISKMTLAELRENFPLRKAGTQVFIPTLKEVIDLTLEHIQKESKNLIVNIEIPPIGIMTQEQRQVLINSTFQVMIDAIKDSKGGLSFNNFIINSFDNTSLIAFRKLSENYPHFGHLRLSLGIYTKDLYGAADTLGPNYIPIERDPSGKERVNDHGLYMLKEDLDRHYLEVQLKKLQADGIDSLDLTSCDMSKTLIEACNTYGIFITGTINDSRASLQFILDEIKNIPESIFENGLSADPSQQVKLFPNTKYLTKQQKNLICFLQENLIGRDKLEVLEVLKMLSMASRSNGPVVYKADDPELARKALNLIVDRLKEHMRRVDLKF